MSKNFNPLKSPLPISAARKAPSIEKGIKITAKGLDFVQKAEAKQIEANPYYTHMPKDDPVAATKYAADMGGEHHDMSKCEIF